MTDTRTAILLPITFSKTDPLPNIRLNRCPYVDRGETHHPEESAYSEGE
jgi:hypothetical protein